MAKFKWRCCANQTVTVNKATAERLTRIGEYVDPNPFFRKRTKAEQARNKEAAAELFRTPNIRGSNALNPKTT